MHYADEIVDVGEIEKLAEDVDRPTAHARGGARRAGKGHAAGGARGGRAGPANREVEMAQQLVESLASKFDPANYHDEYTACVMEMIERKAAGHKVVLRPAAPLKPTRAPDLTAMLKASIEQVRSGKHKRHGRSSSNGHSASDPSNN
jgi:hypothetical protein